jgi:2-keto-3-deoxy-L-rhamnonate aldolase RhmA
VGKIAVGKIVNPLKERLASGGIAVGMGIRALRSAEAARLMKTAGYDWLFIDLEHGPTSIENAYSLCVAALDAGIAPIVRVSAGELAMGARCLDGGALGIVIPHVDTPEQARAMVDAYRFPPVGHRSIAGGYPHFGFAPTPTAQVVEGLNEATFLMPMIETPLAVENAEKIAAIPGIDALLIGTNDLALEMGIPGQLENERLVKAVETVIAACRKHGKTAALGGVYSREPLKRYIARGIRMLLAGNDLGVLLNAATEQSAFVRSCAEPGK